MPVRSLRSSVMRWPDREVVDRAVRVWAERLTAQEPALVAVGYFGSYARGDHGVGSDLDLVVLLSGSDLPRERRALGWDLEALPVPAEVLVYTLDEWRRLRDAGTRLYRVLSSEAVWVYGPHDEVFRTV